MSTRDFIDQIVKGQNAEAQETINDVLSNLAFDAIEQRKKEIASTLFGGIEIDNQQETETESTEEQ
jgi:hypothetical protein